MKITAIDTNKKGAPALMRVAGYARVSVDTFNSAHSLDAQSAFLKKRITSTPSTFKHKTLLPFNPFYHHFLTLRTLGYPAEVRIG